MSTITISILGAGYVGLTSAALLSNAGFKVFLIEPNPTRLRSIKRGKSFFYEKGLDSIIEEGLRRHTLIPTDSYAESIPHSSYIFSCVGTPDYPDGSSNLSYVFSAAQQAAKYANKDAIYVQKSTVPVGTGQRIIDDFSASKVHLSYVSNPEFLREGSTIKDTLWFDRIVAGSDDKKSVEGVFSLYRQLEQHREEIALRAGLQPGTDTEGSYVRTSRVSAELTKVTANAFLALKISFANSIAKLSDAAGADITDVMDAVGADYRIGRAFLNAGRGYGGGCFPKDVSGLISSGLEHGVDLEIMQAAQQVNEAMPGYVIERLRGHLSDTSLENKKIAVLGLAFKAGTSDVRRSPGVMIANLLSKKGAIVTAYDPQANKEAQSDIRKDVTICDTREGATQDAEAIVIATEWPELADLTEQEATLPVLDAVNILDQTRYPSAIGIGR